jgi:hypothetical protein
VLAAVMSKQFLVNDRVRTVMGQGFPGMGYPWHAAVRSVAFTREIDERAVTLLIRSVGSFAFLRSQCRSTGRFPDGQFRFLVRANDAGDGAGGGRAC